MTTSSKNPGNIDHGDIESRKEMADPRDVSGYRIHRITSADLDAGRTGILGTATNNAGTPTAHLTPNTFVTHEGIRMELRTAERLGLVHSLNGEYFEGPRPARRPSRA
jgi:hypothetical protein